MGGQAIAHKAGSSAGKARKSPASTSLPSQECRQSLVCSSDVSRVLFSDVTSISLWPHQMQRRLRHHFRGCQTCLDPQQAKLTLRSHGELHHSHLRGMLAGTVCDHSCVSCPAQQQNGSSATWLTVMACITKQAGVPAQMDVGQRNGTTDKLTGPGEVQHAGPVPSGMAGTHNQFSQHRAAHSQSLQHLKAKACSTSGQMQQSWATPYSSRQTL